MPFKDKHGRVCGFLDVDEKDKKKSFQRRYFILNTSKNAVEWYMDSPSNLDESAQPCGAIDTNYINKVDEAKRIKKDNCFVINTPFRPYYVQASSQSEMEQWIEILNDASRIIVPPEAMNPQQQSTDVTEFTDALEDSLNSGEVDNESVETNCTYRTEIVGNVVIKKKLGETKKLSLDEPASPSFYSSGSDTKFQFTPDGKSSHAGFFSSNDDQNVIKKGWAVKQGHVRKNWKRRYFVLKKSVLAYYKSEYDKDPLRTISMSDVLAAKPEEVEASRLRDNMLLIVTTDKIYYMQADTPGDMQDWVNSLNAAVKAHRLTSTKHQVKSRDGHNFGGSSDILDDSSTNKAVHFPQLTKRASAHAIPQYSIGNAIGSSSSSEKQNTELAHSRPQQKNVKTHRRAESAVTVLPTFTVETMSTSIKTTKASTVGVTYHAEDVKGRPESASLRPVGELAPDRSRKSLSSLVSSKPNSGSYVVNHLDPQIDMRAAVKPSSVMKKKNPGILFSLNTMLSKKQDKIQKEKFKYKNYN